MNFSAPHCEVVLSSRSVPPPSSLDTHPEADRVLFAIWRRMSGAQKLAIVEELNSMTRALTEQRIRERYPDADEREIFLRVAATWLEPELMRRAYGWDPERERRI
jgi:hypothetical protein